MENTVDIAKLVEENPLTEFNKATNYQSKFIDNLRNEFSTEDERLFLSSFYCYANVDPNEFVFDLDKVWRWLKFSQKIRAKELLIKEFTEGSDYKIEKPAFSGEKAGRNLGGAGKNREIIKMTVRCFKKLCLKARTDKADKIHDYYIKLEETVHKTVKEESEELRNQLMIKDNQLKIKTSEILTIKEKTMIKAFGKKPIVYAMKIGEDRKFGFSNDPERRVREHKRDFGTDCTLDFAIETIYNRELETMIKKEFKNRIYSKEFNNKNQTELIRLDDKFTSKIFYNKITEYKKSFDSGEMMVKILQENEKLINENEKLKSDKKEDLINGSCIYIKHIEGTLCQYEVDITDDTTKKDIYLTPNAKNAKKMLYVLLDSFRVNSNSFEMTYDKIKKSVEYCIVMYDSYDIQKSENCLYTYLTRCNDDKIRFQKNNTLIEHDIFKDYMKNNIEHGESYKVTIMQIYDSFIKWYSQKYTQNLDISIRDIKEDIAKHVGNIAKIEKTVVNVTDKATNKKYSTYPGFVGIRLKNREKTTMYNMVIYEEYLKKHIKITNDLNDKVLRKEALIHFENWIKKETKYEWNTKSKGEIRYTLNFMNEFTSIVKNYTKNKYENDKHYSSKLMKGGKGFFTGCIHTEIN